MEIDVPVAKEGGGTLQRLRLEPGYFGDGVWLIEPFCRLEGMAGTRPLRSAVGERCAVALHIDAGIFVGHLNPFLIEDPDNAYRRAIRILSLPIVEASDATVFVGGVYRAAGTRLFESDGGARLFAAELAGEMAPMDSPGYVPRLSPWDIALSAFSGPAEAYDASLPESSAMASFAGLGLLGRTRMVKEVFCHERFELSTAMAFGNALSRAASLGWISQTSASTNWQRSLLPKTVSSRTNRGCSAAASSSTPPSMRGSAWPRLTPIRRMPSAPAAHAT